MNTNEDIWLVELCMLLIGMAFGTIFGKAEALERNLRIAHKDRRKLPHKWLLALRVSVCLACAFLWARWSWDTLQLAGIMFVALTIVHRMVFNHGCEKPIWYMGMANREPDDSLYDTACWVVADGLSRMVRQPLKPWLPFVVATITEVLVLARLFCFG